MKFFDYDSPLMAFLSRMCDIVLLNVLTLIFCIPIVTIGAAMTAAHYTALKLHREEGHLLRCFLKSFWENLKQSTVIWIGLVIHCFVLYWVYNISIQVDNSMMQIVQGVIVASVILTALIYAWVIPLQARFINPISATIKNAFYMAFRYILRTVLMVVFNLLPVGVLVFVIIPLGLRGMSIWLICGISAPIYWSVMAYDKVFEKLEESIVGVEQIETEE